MYSSYVVTKSAKVLSEVLSDVLEDASNGLTGLARLVVQRAKEQWAELDAHIQWCDERICCPPQAKRSGAPGRAAHGGRAGDRIGGGGYRG